MMDVFVSVILEKEPVCVNQRVKKERQWLELNHDKTGAMG